MAQAVNLQVMLQAPNGEKVRMVYEPKEKYVYNL